MTTMYYFRQAPWLACVPVESISILNISEKFDKIKNPLLMYSTIRFGTASKAAPQGRHLYRAGVGVELAIKRLPARCLDH